MYQNKLIAAKMDDVKRLRFFMSPDLFVLNIFLLSRPLQRDMQTKRDKDRTNN
jgi:hypothetical protein